MTASALYVGKVHHRRLRPKVHALAYRVFQLYLDLDEAQALSDESRVFGFNRTRLISLHERDHGDGSDVPLKTQIERKAAAAGFATGGPVRMLTLPRVLGYAFNPITLFFCHDAEGELSAVVHQVNSTFGERCFYVLPANGGDVVEQTAAKKMHVSPFLAMDHAYAFRVTRPAEVFALGIKVTRDGATFLTASFTGERRPFTDKALLAAWAQHPLLTVKVIAGIHWEALKLFLKGVPLVPFPPLHGEGGLARSDRTGGEVAGYSPAPEGHFRTPPP